MRILRSVLAAIFLLGSIVGVAAQDAVPTTGGLLARSLVSAASQNATVAKSTFGQVYAINATGVSSSPAYLKLYDKATAPTCHQDTVKATIAIPALTTGATTNVAIPPGLAFGSGIAFCLTGNAVATDQIGVAANAFIVSIFYK